MQENQENFHNKSIKDQVQLLLVVLAVVCVVLGIAGYQIYKRFQFEIQNISEPQYQELSWKIEPVEPIKEPMKGEQVRLEVLPSQEVVFSDAVIGSKYEAALILRAENGQLVLNDIKLAKEQPDDIVLSGSCMGKGTLLEGDECVVEISWTPKGIQNSQNVLVVNWRENSPSVFVKMSTHVLLKMRAKNAEEKLPNLGWGERVIDSNGIIRDKKLNEKFFDGYKSEDDCVVLSMPNKIPLNLENKLMGIVSNGVVIDFDGEKIGRLLGDDTIISFENAKIIGKAIPSWSVMNEHGHVFGKMVVNLEERAVSVVDAKGKVLGFPHIDGQIVDAQNKVIGLIGPRGIVVDSMGGFVGLILPNGSVMNGKKQIATMRPDGKAIDGNSTVLGVAVSENGAFDNWRIFQTKEVFNQKTDLKKDKKQNKGKSNAHK